MNNVTLLCLFAMFILFVLVVLPRLMNSRQNPNDYEPVPDDRYPPGDEQPRYDNPNIDGRGSFGRDRNPDRGNPTSSGNDTRRQPDSSTGRSRPDDKNVRGRGSFGRDKDR